MSNYSHRRQVPPYVRTHACARRAVNRLGRRVNEGWRDPDHERRQRLVEEALDLAIRLRERAAAELLAASEDR